MASITQKLFGLNSQLDKTLGLFKDINGQEKPVRGTTNVEGNLEDELSRRRLTTNEEE